MDSLTTQPTSPLRAKRGFNLIEAAIVLGVVGLVIGGIWVAAASVQRQMKLDQVVKMISTVQQNLGGLYAQQRPAVFTDVTGNLLRSVTPANFQLDSTNNLIIDPFGGEISVYVRSDYIGYHFASYGDMVEYCFDIAPRLSSVFREAGWVDSVLGVPFLSDAGGNHDLSTMDAINANCPTPVDELILLLKY